MAIRRILVAMTVPLALAACDRPEPRSVQEFMADEIALTGTLVRCQDMGSEAIQDPECQNARRASERLAALDEERQRQAREEEFQRKRAALRERQDRERAAREAAAAAARIEEEQALLGTVTFEGQDPVVPAGDTAEPPAVADQADTDPSLEAVPPETDPGAVASAPAPDAGTPGDPPLEAVGDTAASADPDPER